MPVAPKSIPPSTPAEYRRRLRQAARGLAATLGADFFCSLVKHLSTMLRADCCILGELTAAPEDRIRTLAVFRKRRMAENFDQSILGSALGQVMIDGSFSCSKDALRLFPNDTLLQSIQATGFAGVRLSDSRGQPIGLLALISKSHFSDLPLVRSMLVTFASRAASELERKKADDVHRENEERYHAFIRANPDAMWRVEFAQPIPLTVDEDQQIELINRLGYLAECNDAFVRLAGATTTEELVGSSFSAVAARMNINADEELRAAIRAGFRTMIVESMPLDANGRVAYRLRSQFGIVEKGELLRVWGTTRDITDLRRAELSLAASERRFRDILEGIQLPAVMLDSRGAVAFCNDYFLTLAGRSREELQGLQWTDYVVPAEEGENWDAKSDDYRRQATKHFEGLVASRDGHWRSILWDAICLRDQDDKVAGLAAIGRDITYQKALETKVLQTQKLDSIGRVAVGLAHDFNNFLSVVVGHVSDLLRSCDETDPRYERLTEIQRAADLCAKLTSQLLTFGRKQELEPGLIILNDVVAAAETLVRRLLGAGTDLVLDLASPLWPVYADATQMQRVLANLAANARDAMPMGGRVTISTTNLEIGTEDTAFPGVKSGPYVKLSFADNGKGIPEEVKTYIFEPFFTTKRAGKGSGLGLSTVYGIVTQSNGYVFVWSELSKGTVLDILLPASIIATKK